MCSVVAITIIKGTYAYPLTMENTGGGKIVPLGGDEVCSKCDNSYVYAPVGAENCTPVADSYCTIVHLSHLQVRLRNHLQVHLHLKSHLFLLLDTMLAIIVKEIIYIILDIVRN